MKPRAGSEERDAVQLVQLQPWQPAPAAFDRAAATHLFARAGFGASRDVVDRAVADGLDRAIGQALADDGDEALRAGIEKLLPTGEIAPLQAWWVALVLHGGSPLRERVALMWHGHFATSFDKVQDSRMMHAQNALLREHGLGDFRALLHRIARDPAMLVWLDGNENQRGRPNENFAREVMELFALGIGNYDEHDVREAARAFTGLGTSGRSFVFRAALHDGGSKTVLGRAGTFGGDEVLDVVLAHPAAPRHVARVLLREFVEPVPSDAAIAETAAVLVANEWHIGRTIETIVRSELFFSPAARRSRIAGPVELVARAVHVLGAHVAPRDAAQAAEHMGQALFRPPSVKGWDGHRAWINAGAWIARHNFLAGLARAHVEKIDRTRVNLRVACGEPQSREQAAELVLSTLLCGVDAPKLAARARSVASESADVDHALADAAALVLTSPEFQLT